MAPFVIPQLSLDFKHVLHSVLNKKIFLAKKIFKQKNTEADEQVKFINIDVLR